MPSYAAIGPDESIRMDLDGTDADDEEGCSSDSECSSDDGGDDYARRCLAVRSFALDV